jgi:processive 1,2-diacylglycerol beta-glucosyltransferase
MRTPPELERVLILSVSAGMGHFQAALAIKKAFQEIRPDVQVSILDTFRYVNPFLDKIIFGTYIEMLKTTPVIYKHLYNLAEKEQPFSKAGKKELNKLFNKLAAPKLIRLLNSYRPQVVVCTHPFPVGIVDKLKQQGYLSSPVVATLTDFTVHPFWVFPRVDLFTVAAPELQISFREHEISQDRVHALGIPINTCFSTSLDKAIVCHKLGFKPDLPTVLIIGGGLGMGPLENIVKTLGKNLGTLQMIIVTGNNDSLKAKLEQVRASLKNPLRILGFVDNIHELMAAADLMVGKAGGLTCAEALASGLPIFVVAPIPGQEVRNTEFLTGQGAALRVDSMKELAQKVEEYLGAPGLLQKMANNAKRLGKPLAAYDIVRLIEMAGCYKNSTIYG